MLYYFRYFHEKVLQVYAREFKGGQKVKFVKNEVPDGFGSVMEVFEKEAETLEFKQKFNELKMAEDHKHKSWEEVSIDGSNLRRKYLDVMDQWINEFLKKLDEILEDKVYNAILATSGKRCSISGTVYDFTSKKVDKKLIEKLNLGGNFVLHRDDLDEDTARDKLEQELSNYVIKYRRFIQKKSSIDKFSLLDWLREAVRTSEGEHLELYESLLEYKTVKMSRKRFVLGEDTGFDKLDSEGIIVLECDKNCGLAILEVNEVIKADLKMVEELGGKECKGQGEGQIKENIKATIEDFEESICGNGKKYLSVYYPERKCDPESSMLPFLKLKVKIHKLSKDELDRREIKKLKFRPVIDSSRTPFHFYSKALMDYTSELTRKLCNKYFSGRSPLVKNGHQVAQFLASLNGERNNGTFMAIADLASAYTFIYVENLKFAMRFAARELDIPEWKDEMFQKMAGLILENSYVETSGGIYKLSSCLPMGLGVSGEALDLVCLVSEIGLFGKIIPPELSRCSELYPDWRIQDEANLMASVKNYFRYRDDTFTYAEVNGKKTIQMTIMALGSAFLSTLDINVDLSHFIGSYLDCFFYKKLTGDGFITLVRRRVIIQ